MRFSEHFVNFFQTFGLYVDEFYVYFFDHALWLVPILTCFAIYLLVIIFSKLRFISLQKNKTFVIAKSYVIASMLAALIIVILSFHSWAIDFRGYFDSSFRLSFIISICLAFLIAIIKYFQLKNFYTRNNLKNITNQPITALKEKSVYLNLKRAFGKFKLWVLLPLFGFLLLFLTKERHTLISIVIDASGSMADGRLDYGKNGLTKTLKLLSDENTDYIISVSPHNEESQCLSYTNFRDILSITDPERLCSFTALPFLEESPINFINDISYYEGVNSNHAHILYSLWHNYLVSKQFLGNNQKVYDTKSVIIASDFQDEDLAGALPTFFNDNVCNEQYGYVDFYGDNVFIINLNDRRETFITKFEECNIGAVYDGFNIDTYSTAIQEIFDDMKPKSWYFVIWIALFYVVLSIVFFSINPKKLRDI